MLACIDTSNDHNCWCNAPIHMTELIPFTMFQINKDSWKLMSTTATEDSSLIQGYISVSTTKCVTSEEIITPIFLHKDKTFRLILKAGSYAKPLSEILTSYFHCQQQTHPLLIEGWRTAHHVTDHDSLHPQTFCVAGQKVHLLPRFSFLYPVWEYTTASRIVSVQYTPSMDRLGTRCLNQVFPTNELNVGDYVSDTYTANNYDRIVYTLIWTYIAHLYSSNELISVVYTFLLYTITQIQLYTLVYTCYTIPWKYERDIWI